MFSQFKQLIREYGEKLVNQNPEVPENHKKAVVNEARKTLQAGIKKLKANGKMNQLAQMFKSGKLPDTNQSMIRRLSEGMVSGMSQKFNISKPTARTIAATLVLGVIGGLFTAGVLMSTRASAQSKQASASPTDFHRGKKGHGRRALAAKGALEGGLKTIRHKHIRTKQAARTERKNANEAKRA